jgi:two-component sensor histidine kinase
MDITDRKRAEREIERSLNEKEILIREIHHRVKNNLQIISSLLNLQYSRLPSDNYGDYFITSRNRIRSIAVVHEMLYKNDTLSEINFTSYISELSRLIADSYNADNIKIDIKAGDIVFGIDVTINLGLVINEIISNAVKHAFNGTKEGVITIELLNQNNFYFLSIKDNGKGFPKDFDVNNTSTLGISLISNLILQIEGKLEIKNNVGTEYLITFQV